MYPESMPCHAVLCCAMLLPRYPTAAGGLLGNWQLVEGMKESFCFSAQDYGGLLQKALAEPTTAGAQRPGGLWRTKCLQLNSVFVVATRRRA